MLIDDFSSVTPISKLGTKWRKVSDAVMGGVSQGELTFADVDGRSTMRLSGSVRLENNGGFIQASIDLAKNEGILDASDFKGIRVTARGNNETYSLHLRTHATTRPWQSYRVRFAVKENWQTFELPFSRFEPHRLEAPLDVSQLKRLGLVAIGREFFADVWVSRLEFYR